MDKDKSLSEITEMVRQHTYDSQSDPYRLAFHLTPPFGLLNDPNGLIHFNGYYHVFFQWNPWSTDHTYKCWGHYRSKDWVNWELLPPALLPEDWYDKNGCYSGSAIEYEGKLFLFYTGNVKNLKGERESYQCVAISEDGVHFEKQGPVIHVPEGYTAHFRDPKVWEENGIFYMVLGAQTVTEEGCTVLFSSQDLNKWDFLGPVAGNGLNELENFGYMWECPDFFKLNDSHVILVSPQGLEPNGIHYQNLFQSGYFVGQWNPTDQTYQHRRKFTEIDKGFDFYAPQTLLDHQGRRIMLAWMGMGDEKEQEHVSITSGWIHALTIPRELTLEGEHVLQRPLEELKQLRKENYNKEYLLSDEETSIELPSHQQEIILDLLNEEFDLFKLHVGQAFTLIFKQDEKKVSLVRKAFNGLDDETRQAEMDELKKLHIFLDRSSVEIFLNDGKEVFTARIYPKEEDRMVTLSVKGNTKATWNSWTLGKYDIVKL